MKIVFVLIFNVVFTSILSAQTSVSITDIQSLENSSWKGSLMYINYGDGQEVTLRTTMQIQIKGEKIILLTQFTDEPNANSKDSIKVKKGGTYFGKEKITERTDLKNGTLKIVTTFMGNDNNKPATIRKTYLIGQTEFSITKSVQFTGSEETLIRNQYSYTRI